MTSNQFTLQLFHSADQEAGVPAIETAPNFSAVLNGLRNEDLDGDGEAGFANTVTLSSGDAYIPGPFFAASESAFGAPGRADILIQNELGFEAIAFGNHEFDAGTGVVRDLLLPNPDANYPGALFPYLSANLDFSTDDNLDDLVVADGQEASTIPNSIAGNTIITLDGERIGVVGATTPTLPSISNPGDVTVRPLEFDSNDPEDIAALAGEIQTSVDSLIADNPDVNKVILLAHFQQISIERQVAELLTDVDIVVAGGSNTLLADETDRLRAGDEAQGPYPILSTAADGNPVAIVNTDGNYQYVGRLVVDFDADGVIIPESIDATVSGAYATDDAGVSAVNGTPDPEIVAITDELAAVIAEQEGNIFGSTEVFINGIRGDVRTQETNLGNLTADANLAIAQSIDPDVVISIKNGGGIRDSIGEVIVPPGATDPSDFERVPPQANELAGKEEGDISQTDIANALRFNNGLTLLTLTAEELLAVIENGVSQTEEGATPGSFPQVAGLAFSFDADLPAGDRVVSLAVRDDAGNNTDVIVQNGEIVGNPERTFRIVTLNFLADGGDDYPFPDRERADLAQPDEAARTGVATFAPDGTEQDALAEFLTDNFSNDPFARQDTPPQQDERIQNLDFRADVVIDINEIMGTIFADEIIGTDGDDLINSLDGRDTVDSGAGFDTVNGGPGSDLIDGGTGFDDLNGGLGNDTLNGGGGRDTLNGGDARDLLDGSFGVDLLSGGAGQDTLNGGAGRDTLNGNDVRDFLLGGRGNDILDGGLGRDVLNGDEGNDTLIGSRQQDILNGGEGADTFVYRRPDVGERDFIFDFAVGEDKIDVSQILDRPIYMSNNPFASYISLTSRGPDTVVRVDLDGDRPNIPPTGLVVLAGVDASTLSADDFIVE